MRLLRTMKTAVMMRKVKTTSKTTKVLMMETCKHTPTLRTIIILIFIQEVEVATTVYRSNWNPQVHLLQRKTIFHTVT